jgi:exopolyphosphatase/pppGpp-phosphohydrolase
MTYCTAEVVRASSQRLTRMSPSLFAVSPVPLGIDDERRPLINSGAPCLRAVAHELGCFKPRICVCCSMYRGGCMYSICARVQRVVRAVLERSQGWLVHARTPTSRLRVSSEDRERARASIDRSAFPPGMGAAKRRQWHLSICQQARVL